MGNKINVNINSLFSLNYDAGICVADLIHDYKKVTGKPVIGAKINNVIVDWDTKLYEDTTVNFIDCTDAYGCKMYQAGVKFVLIIAVKNLWKKTISFKYSLDKGVYAEIDKELSEKDIIELKEEMKKIISYDYPIKKCIAKRDDALRYYESTGDEEKYANVCMYPTTLVELYEINHIYNHLFTNMPYSTCDLGNFEIHQIDKNAIVLLTPRSEADGMVPDFFFNERIYTELINYSKWAKIMNCEYVSDINKKIANQDIEKFIEMNDILLDGEFYAVCIDIYKKKDIKMILIGGPSSSGKTTSAHRLCTYLKTFGFKPILISADNYFKERGETPKDKDGNYNFEGLDAMDLDLFNDHMKALLKGESVVLPTFDFVDGHKLFTNPAIKMEEDNVLVIEGIHCLNDKMTKSVSRENKYKIYVCPFTPLALDKHNHLSTTDMRTLRRIVRDNRLRGRNVEATLRELPRVSKGENENIFPYTRDIDAVLNTAYTYEIGVLKVFVEPLLASVPMSSIYYEKARRLLGLLRMFYPISSEYIDKGSVLREFIGGSKYE